MVMEMKIAIADLVLGPRSALHMTVSSADDRDYRTGMSARTATIRAAVPAIS